MRRVFLAATLLVVICVVIGVLSASAQSKHGWPIEPTNKEHPIGSSFGEFQDFGSAYHHAGIDVLGNPKFKPDGTEDTAAPWVCVTVGGKVTELGDNNADKAQNGTTILGTDGTTYRYWHLQEKSYYKDYEIHYKNNTSVAAGDKIAKLTRFPSDFHHVHYDLEKSSSYLNPLADITPNPDPDLPDISAIGFADDNSDPWKQFKPVSFGGCTVVSGTTDIIAQIRDRDDAGSTTPGTATLWVYNIRWRACPDSSPACAWFTTHAFDNMPIWWGSAGNKYSSAYWSNRAPWDSDSDYSKATWLYGIATNFIMLGTPDVAGDWDTTTVTDGSYSVSVEATDFAGNKRVYGTRACVQNTTSCVTELTIRDAADDTGAIPYPGANWWISPDITVNPGTPDEDKNVHVGIANPIEVRVWNYGSCNLSAGTTYTVCLGWGLPSSAVSHPLPSKQKIGCTPETVPAGGWAVGASRVTKFSWTPAVGSVALGHHCLVAWVDTSQDNVLNTPAVNLDDNRAQQNITFKAAPAPGVAGQSSFWINPQEMIENRGLVLSFKYSEQAAALQRARLHVEPGLAIAEVIGGDITGGDEGYEWTIEGIDPFGQLRLEGIQVQEPVRLTLEVFVEDEVPEGQFVDAEVVEHGLLPGHEETVPIGGLTLRFVPRGEVRSEIRLTFGGELLAGQSAREAILHAVPWLELTVQIFPGQDVRVGVGMWEVGPVLDDARGWPFDRDRSRELLAELGFAGGLRLTLLVQPRDEQLTRMAEWMAEALGNVGIQLELVEVSAVDAPDVMAEMVAGGEPVLWLSR
jgi:hypothetical protein